MGRVREESLLNSLNELNQGSLVILLNSIRDLNKNPDVIRKIIDRGYVKSVLPVDGGLTLIAKRGFTKDFTKYTIEVYRDSFVLGPNPIQYNTAYALYILSKFVSSHRNGIILEIGTGRGFSTLWLAHIAMEFNSRVISLDNNLLRVNYARDKMREIDLDRYVEIIYCDAKEYTHIGEDINLVFIDGKKEEYHRYLEVVERALTPGSIIIAHNTISSSHEMKPYLKKIYGRNYESITIATDPAGITISVYK
jgi:predicted O-methyltransferase YrrM